MTDAPQVVLITGCSGGFGDRMARTLAQAGHVVYASMRHVAGRNRGAAEDLESWARQANVRMSIVELDVTDDDAVEGTVERIIKDAGRIDVAINNAAAGSVGPLEAFSIDQVKAIFDANVFGPMRVHKAVLPGMRRRRSGLIVEVTSVGGRVMRRGGLYPSTKWAQEAIAESLYNEVRPFGIDVAIIEPGSFPTGMLGKSIHAADRDIAEAYATAQPPRPQPISPGPDYELPDPQEVADAVLGVVQGTPGQRPLRTVVGRVLSTGVANLNAAYEKAQAELRESALRPDQATPWI